MASGPISEFDRETIVDYMAFGRSDRPRDDRAQDNQAQHDRASGDLADALYHRSDDNTRTTVLA